MSRIQRTKYGTNAIGVPYPHTDYGSTTWFREDTYTTNEGEVVQETRFAAGPDDLSDQASVSIGGYPGNVEYDSHCSSCYLGHSHTVAQHRRNLGLVHDSDQPPTLTAEEWFQSKSAALVV